MHPPVDILMISHLKDLTSLTRLDLNNNMIERIEGVDHLRNLTWLSKMKRCVYIYLSWLNFDDRLMMIMLLLILF